jgi:hypothetical protein
VLVVLDVLAGCTFADLLELELGLGVVLVLGLAELLVAVVVVPVPVPGEDGDDDEDEHAKTFTGHIGGVVVGDGFGSEAFCERLSCQ